MYKLVVATLAAGLYSHLVALASSTASLPSLPRLGGRLIPWIPDDVAATGKSVRDKGPPLDPEGSALNCIMVMYDLCFLDQDAPLARRVWSEKGWDIYVQLDFTEVRQGLWAMYNLYDALATAAGHLPMRGQLHQRRILIGRFSIGHLNQPVAVAKYGEDELVLDSSSRLLSTSTLPFTISLNSSTATRDIEKSASNSVQPWSFFAIPSNSTLINLSLDNSPEVSANGYHVNLKYSGKSFPQVHFFWNIISTMGFLAGQESRKTNGIAGEQGGLILESKKDSDGQPLLTVADVLKIINVMTKWMVRNHQYGETDIELSKGGRKIAEGRYTAPTHLDTSEN